MGEITTNYESKYIIWEATTVCNYSCRYCWPEYYDGKYRWPDDEKTDKLIKYIKKFSEDKKIIFDIMGGEPTLWPNLQKFCYSIKDYAYTTFSSNGSRTVRWWDKFTAPLDHLILSFHPEFANVDHYVNVLKTIHQRYGVTVYILYHPEFKDICLRAWNSFTKGNLEISCQMKRIYTDEHSQPVFSTEYSEEDKKILMFNYNNRKIQLHLPKMDLIRDGKIVDPHEEIAKGLNSFTGWQCNLGGDLWRYILADGTIYGSACRMRSPMGNVYTDGETTKPACVTCTLKYCNCRLDLILNKKTS